MHREVGMVCRQGLLEIGACKTSEIGEYSLLETGECKIVCWWRGNAGMQWNAGFKAGVEWEVTFSQQLYFCCHWSCMHLLFVKYLATGSREDGAQALKFQFECTNLVSTLLTCRKEDERRPKSHPLSHDELCVASRRYFSFGFFPSWFKKIILGMWPT